MRTLPQEPSSSEIQPWHSLGGAEHICELTKSCMVLYGIFTEIARSVYHDLDGRLIGTPEVLWTPKGTQIWTDNELRWEDQHPECRPAIYIQLGQQQRKPTIPGIGLSGMTMPANRFGERTYSMTCEGTVTYMHVASTVGEACALADNTAYALGMMQNPIKRDFCFSQFLYTGRIPLEKLPKEATEKYASGVVFSYEFEDAWKVKEECPILKQVNMIDNELEEASVYGNVLNRDSGQFTINSDNIVTERKVP